VEVGEGPRTEKAEVVAAGARALGAPKEGSAAGCCVADRDMRQATTLVYVEPLPLQLYWHHVATDLRVKSSCSGPGVSRLHPGICISLSNDSGAQKRASLCSLATNSHFNFLEICYYI
jgi:hypothetical protein